MKKYLLALLLAPCIALAQSPSLSTIRLLKMSLAEDYRGAVTNKKAAFSWGQRTFDYDVQAIQIAREYRASPESAALQYEGHWIKINGPVDRLGSDSGGKPFVDLSVFSESSADIRATFASVSAFSNGQDGPLICKVSGSKNQKPILNQCIYQYLIGSDRAVPPFIDQPMNDWLEDGRYPWFATTQGQRKALSAMLTALDQVSDKPACRNGLSQDCQDLLLQTIQSNHAVTK